MQAVVDADELVARGVVAVDLPCAAEERVVVAALAVLGLVVDCAALDLDFADRVGALVVRHVVQCFEEAELDVRKETQLLGLLGLVADGDFPDLEILAGRYEHQLLDLDAILLAGDAGVAKAMAALEGIEFGAGRFPTGIPDRLALLHIQEAAVVIHRVVVVAITREATELGVLPEGVAARGLRRHAEELVLAEIIQPGQGRVWACDNIFAVGVVKVSVVGHGGVS